MIRSCVHSKVGVSVVDPKGELWPCCKYQRDSDNPLPTIFDVDTLDKLHNNSPYEKIKFDNISAEKIKVLEEPNYTNIIKSAVSNSDAIVQGSQEIPDEISEEIKNTDVPALSYQEEDSFDSYLNFYKDLISEE